MLPSAGDEDLPHAIFHANSFYGQFAIVVKTLSCLHLNVNCTLYFLSFIRYLLLTI